MTSLIKSIHFNPSVYSQIISVLFEFMFACFYLIFTYLKRINEIEFEFEKWKNTYKVLIWGQELEDGG